MALPKSYLTSTKNLKSILDAIQTAQAPERFNLRFLEALGFTSSNDRLIIGVLKELGFLDTEGKPLDRYFRFLDQTQSEKVLAEGIRDAYADLFAIRTDAHKLTKEEIINKAKTLFQGTLSESVLDKFSLTFTALVRLADFSEFVSVSKPPTNATEENDEDASLDRERNTITADLTVSGRKNTTPERGRSLGGLHYNIQIILPSTRDSAIYDAIFRSLKEHLFD